MRVQDIHYNYCGLSAEETTEYIYSRIEAAGYCQGAPRIINAVMTNALMLGAQLKKKSIDSDTILAASNSLALG